MKTDGQTDMKKVIFVRSYWTNVH